MKNQLLENLFVYKKTSALLAAFQLGIFRKIKEHLYLNKDICHQLGWNESHAELLCIYLAKEGYLIEVDNGWQINKDFESQLETFEKICEHENSLYYKWLSPEVITSSVKSSIDGRLFDKEGFTSEEQKSYDTVMYGSNTDLLAFHLLRKMKHEKISSVRCLEYGRSIGRIGQALKKHIPEINIDIVTFNQVINNQSPYDVILIYNAIHYKSPKEWEAVFKQMKKTLNEYGFICIFDVFYKEESLFQSTVLLDWITHGGIYNIYNYEVVKQLQSIGFNKIEQQFIESISTDMIFVYK